jgi:transposase InsO family protein
MPFTTSDLHDYLSRVQLTTEARQYILDAAASPSRDVGRSPYRTVVSDFPSLKMGMSIATESRTGELAYAVMLEYADDVLAFYDQPPAVECIRTNRIGREGAKLYHPDFLVLRRSGAEVVQIKSRDQATKLVLERPAEWILEGTQIRDLAAERALEAFGIPHRVVCSDDLPRSRISNLKLLLQARRSTRDELERQYDRILRQVRAVAVQSLADLAAALALKDFTPVLRLIDLGEITVDLDRTLLSDPSSCIVSSSPTVLAAFLDETRSDWKWDISADVEMIPPLKQAQQALRNLEKLNEEPSSRSARRWRRAIEQQRQAGRSAFYAVLPKTFRSGNRLPKRPVQVLAFAEHVIRSYWATAARPMASGAYRMYRLRAREWHPQLQAVSRATFARLLEHLKQGSALARGGTRFANAAESPTSVQHRTMKATRPFECAVCDHYLMDIWCVLARTEATPYCAKPWMSVMRDVATGLVLATWISFKPPSRIACAMMLRSCARRYRRFPEEVIVDRGSDFRSVYFASFLIDRGVTLTFRPPGHARYGSEAERFFGLFKTQWLSARPGNTVDFKEARSVSASHAPKALAALELVDLLREVEQYRSWFAAWIPGGSEKSPNQLMNEGLAMYSCSGIAQCVDDAFLIASAVDETKIKLDSRRGLKVGDWYYWNEALSAPGLRASQVLVRRDPENFSRVYVRVAGRWSAAHSSGAPSAAAADPVDLVARSIIALDGSKVREQARDENDMALVRALRDVDLGRGGQSEIPAPSNDGPDPFLLPPSAVEPAPIESWSDR